MKQSNSGRVKDLETVCSYVWKFTQHSRYLSELFSNDANPLVYTYQPLYWLDLVGVGLNPPFTFRTALILRGIDSTRSKCWSMLTAPHSCCSQWSVMWICRSTTSQKIKLIDWDSHLVSVDAFECSELSNSVNYHHLTHHPVKQELFLLFHSKWRS